MSMPSPCVESIAAGADVFAFGSVDPDSWKYALTSSDPIEISICSLESFPCSVLPNISLMVESRSSSIGLSALFPKELSTTGMKLAATFS